MADRFQGRPFRADDDYDRQAAQPQGDSDPLAELARLIGQTDPFAGIGRDARFPPSPAGREARAPIPTDPEPRPAPPSWMQRVTPREQLPPSFEEPAEAHPYAAARRGQDFQNQDFQNQDSQDEDFQGDAYQAQDYQAPYYQGQEYQPQEYQPPEHQSQDYQPLPSQAFPGQRADAAYDQNLDPERYDDALYGPADGEAPRFPQAGGYPDDPYALQPGYGDEAGEPVRKPQRGGMMTVVVVLALAFVGTAAAYTYRTFTGTPRSGDAPIIKAEPGPNKIVPPTQSADGSGKLIQDRISSGPGTERMVSREEQPVDVNNAKSGPRVVFPPLTQNPNPAGVQSTMPATRPAAANGAASGTLGGDEPRKVRTLSIRPDQPDGMAAPAATPPAKPVSAPRAAASPASSPAASSAAPAANAPMSLSPQAAAPTRTASNAPVATAPAAASTGGYLVQIASQRSEADAQASYRALQGKYPAVLGSRSPLIKRADLGEKGVYYRAMVGPFGTPDEASQFCGSLKSAGGQCVVQRN